MNTITQIFKNASIYFGNQIITLNETVVINISWKQKADILGK